MADEKFSNFLTEIIDADLAEGKVREIHTRFPPEPNGYLHIGSAKAIYINYMTAKTYGGKFNLRFDDTNPAREGDEYVQSILKDLEWLGATPNGGIFYLFCMVQGKPCCLAPAGHAGFALCLRRIQRLICLGFSGSIGQVARAANSSWPVPGLYCGTRPCSAMLNQSVGVKIT